MPEGTRHDCCIFAYILPHDNILPVDRASERGGFPESPRQIATALFGMTAWRHEHHHLPTRQLARIRQ